MNYRPISCTNNVINLLLGLVAFVFFSPVVRAYEIETHEEMSGHAAVASVLGQGGVLTDIGLGSLYSQRLSGLTIYDWFRFGARVEDDIPRFRNHFFNPLTGQGLFNTFYPSPTWGLENFNGGSSIASQDYSLVDALNYYYLGLTHSDKTQREENLGLTFRTLGQVVHLLQDAAQPQHVRNDSHGLGSTYERVTNELRLGLPYLGYPYSKPKVGFTSVRQFWNTLTPANNLNAVLNHVSAPGAQGISEYANRGFVSAGTNFRFSQGVPATDPNFPMPFPDLNSVWSTDIQTLAQKPQFQDCRVNPNLQGQLTFYRNFVVDSYDPASSAWNDYTTTLSIYNADLVEIAGNLGEGFFSLNRFNFCAAQSFLVPRAVGYSAGLISYFFRGKLDASFTEDNGLLRISITNMSGPENILNNGFFEIYYDATDNTRKRLIDPQPVITGGLANNASQEFSANLPMDLGASRSMIVVFQGMIGTEKGVIGKLSRISEGHISGTITYLVGTRTPLPVGDYGYLPNQTQGLLLKVADRVLTAQSATQTIVTDCSDYPYYVPWIVPEYKIRIQHPVEFNGSRVIDGGTPSVTLASDSNDQSDFNIGSTFNGGFDPSPYYLPRSDTTLDFYLFEAHVKAEGILFYEWAYGQKPCWGVLAPLFWYSLDFGVASFHPFQIPVNTLTFTTESGLTCTGSKSIERAGSTVITYECDSP